MGISSVKRLAKKETRLKFVEAPQIVGFLKLDGVCGSGGSRQT